jgi:hypothetical protein
MCTIGRLLTTALLMIMSAGLVQAQTPARSPADGSTSLAVIRTWSPVSQSVIPNPGYVLLAIELAATKTAETQLKATDLIVVDASGRHFEPVGSAAISWDNTFQPFAGFVSGWRTISGQDGSSIKIGRATAGEPISFVLTGGEARLFLLYIVPDATKSLALSVGAGKPIPFVFQR